MKETIDELVRKGVVKVLKQEEGNFGLYLTSSEPDLEISYRVLTSDPKGRDLSEVASSTNIPNFLEYLSRESKEIKTVYTLVEL